MIVAVHHRTISYPQGNSGLPWLARIVHLKVCEAEALGFKESPYGPLLENHEPGAREKDLSGLFDALRRELVPLTNAITHARRKADVSILSRTYPLDRPAREQYLQAGRQRAANRGQAEQRNPRDQHPPTAKMVTHSAAEQQQSG